MTKQHRFFLAGLAKTIKIKMDYSVTTILYWEKKISKLFLKIKNFQHIWTNGFFSQICEVGWLRIVSALMLK